MVEYASNLAAQTSIRLVVVGRGIAHLLTSHQPQRDSTFGNVHQAMLCAVSCSAVRERT